MELPFAAPGLVASAYDRIVGADGLRRQVEIRDRAGKLLVIARRPNDVLKPIQGCDRSHYVANAAERARPRGAAAARDAQRGAEARLALLPSGRALPPYDALMLDGSRRIWLRDYLPSPGIEVARVWNVLNFAGELVARITLPGAVTVMHAAEDYVTGVVRDDTDTEYVVVYRLVSRRS